MWHVRVASEMLLLGEDRDPEARQATFFCLKMRNGEEVWRKGDYGDRWWIGITAIFNDTLLLHGFSSPDLPIHRGIIAIDLSDGSKKWERPDLVVQGTNGKNLVGHSFASSGEEYLEVSPMTGETLGALDRQSAQEFPSLEDAVEFPVPVEEVRTGNDELLKQIAPSLAGLECEGPILAFARRNRVAISLHERRPITLQSDPRFRHSLQLIDTASGRTMLRRVLDDDTSRLIPDPFFVHRDTLYCVRERRTLMAIPLGISRDPYPAP